MPINKTVRRLFSHEHVCILTHTTLISDSLTKPQIAFYTPLCEAFEKAVSERLYPLALDAFNLCEDRRKRWRYTPWKAEICIRPENDSTLLFRLSSPYGIDLEEYHKWQNGVIIRRLKRK